MSTTEERKSREVAEASREKEWKGETFLRDLFLGSYRPDLLQPYPDGAPARPEFTEFYEKLKRFLKEEVDPVEIDTTGEYPQRVVDGLRALGAFGIKIGKEYGGLGLTHPEYVQVMKLVGSHDANVTALLSAHQAIGVPQPVKLFGTEEQKRRFLPRCAKGAISAFCLTEPAVGSDPARLATLAEPTEDGRYFVLNGEKLWTTNGTLAELLVVMARNPKTDRINAFVVESAWSGVHVDHRCRFMGLKALANAEISFRNVMVPRENLIGREGDGLKIALVTLNTGRLTLPAATTGAAKMMLETVRKWGNARHQWGGPIGHHEAIAAKISDIAATTFAMEAVADLVGDLADRPGYDLRLEAAAAKEWNTSRAWKIVDEALQIRGGRGYETERSLAERGEAPVGVERAMRDARINLIFEGSSEIMHLFMAREAVDTHLQVAAAFADPDSSAKDKLQATPKAVGFYARWYPARWLGWSRWPRYREFGALARHLRWAERTSRRLARTLFHGMVVWQAGMQRKQAFLFRAVDVAMEVFALTASVLRARRMLEAGLPEGERAVRVADVFARGARRRADRLLREMWRNDDALAYAFAREVLDGRHVWLERGAIGLPFTEEELRPPTVREILRGVAAEVGGDGAGRREEAGPGAEHRGP